jgi:hypothetical protein
MNEKVFFNGKVDEISLRGSGDLQCNNSTAEVTLSFVPNDIDEIKTLQKLYGKQFSFIELLTSNGTIMTLYASKCVKHTTRLPTQYNPTMDIFTFTFDTLIENKCGSVYYGFQIDFLELDELFPPPAVELINHEEDYSKITVIPEQCQNTIIKIPTYGSISHRAQYPYIEKKTGKRYSLSYQQKQFIELKYDEAKSLVHVIDEIVKIKRYFEFVLQKEIKIEQTLLLCDVPYKAVRLIYSRKLLYYHIEDERPFKISTHYPPISNILEGLKGWLTLDKSLEIGVSLWMKQIYNHAADQSDIILWDAQCIESLAQNQLIVYQRAKEYAAEKAENNGNKNKSPTPNLADYLLSLKNSYPQLSHLQEKYFAVAKSVRDKVTHYNPQKEVTANQRSNAEQLLANASRKYICQIIGLEKMPFSCCYTPDK